MDLKLSVLLAAIDKATAPLRAVTGGAKGTAKALRETRRSLKELDKAQRDLNGFRKLRSETRDVGSQMRSTRQRATDLGKAIAATKNPARAQVREFNAAKRAAEQLEQRYQENTRRLQGMRSTLSSAGIDTRRLADHERRLREQVGATTAQLTKQEAVLERVNAAERRAAVARASFGKSQVTAAHLAIGGAAAMATGRHVVDALHPGLDEASRYGTEVQRVRALGLGEKASRDAEAFAGAMNTIGTSVTDNLQLMRDAMAVFGDEHHAEVAAPILAKVKYINEALYGAEDAAANEEKFVNMLKVIELRGGTKSPAAFANEANAVQKVLTATGGRVGPDQWREFIQRGGVAAKQLGDHSFYYGMEPLVQEMGGATAGTGLMSLYQNLYQGRSTVRAAKEMLRLGLLDKDKVEYNSIGNIKQIRPGALKGGDLFKADPQAWLEKVLLPALQAKGITDDGQVKDTIAAIVGNRTGANLLTTMYMQRAQIHKNMRLSEGADGIDAAFGKAQQTARGTELDWEAKKADLYRQLGNQLLPVYVSCLQKLVSVTGALTRWSQRHPAMTKGILLLAGAFGVLLTGAGALMVTLGGLIGQFALLRFAMRMGGIRLGLGAVTEGAAASGAGGAMGWLSKLPKLLTVVRGMAAGVIEVIGGISGAVLAIGAAIAVVILGVVLLVRKYWEPIKAWFQGVGQGIAQAMGPVLENVGKSLAPLKPAWDLIATVIGAVGRGIAWVWHWFVKLIEPIHATGAQLDAARNNGAAFGRVIGAVFNGVIRALSFGVRMFVWLGEAIGNAAGFVVTHWDPVKAWFADLWDGISGGAKAALGWIEGKIAAIRAVIDKLASAWHRLHGDTDKPTAQPVQWITGDETGVVATPPLRAAASRTITVQGDTVQMHVDARGMDHAQAKAAVKQALEEHQRAKQARARSTYHDED